MGNYIVHIVLKSNLSSVIFFKNHGYIIQKGIGIMRSIIFRPHGGMTMFYVNGSVVRLDSRLFIILIHSNFSKKEYIY